MPTATAVDASTVTVTAVRAPPSGLPAGVTVAEQGLDVQVTARPPAPLEVHLQLPPEPSAEVIPIVVHLLDGGLVVLEPGLWQPASNEVVVRTDQFSSRFGAWIDPAGWARAFWNGTTDVVDYVADFATGRTDPPPCRNDAPGWASVATTELSSVHVCLQSNPTPDGVQRVEVLLASNRETAQLVTVPGGVDYAWVEGEVAPLRALLSEWAGGEATGVVLLGGSSMSFGYRQPSATSLEIEVRAYLSKRLGVVNQVLGLFGALDGDSLTAIASAAYSCAEGFGDGGLSGSTGLKCVLEALAEPLLLVGTVDELLRAADLGVADRNVAISRMRTVTDRLAPTAQRIVRAVDVVGASTRAWDAIFDNTADGLLKLTMAPAEVTQDVCSDERLQEDLGDAEAFVIEGRCGDGWAYVGTCRGECGDHQLVAQLVNERWTVFTGFPSPICRSEVLAAGAPPEIVDRINWVCESNEGGLAEGSSGDAVQRLQEDLAVLGYDLGPSGIDGSFGPATAAAVRRWQTDTGRESTGRLAQAELEAIDAEASIRREALTDDDVGALACSASDPVLNALEDGTTIAEITVLDASCAEAYPLIYDVVNNHEWGGPATVTSDGFLCTFSQLQVPAGEAGSQGIYSCVADRAAGSTTITWLYARAE